LNADNKYYIHSWIYKNVFEYNYEVSSKQKKYSTEFIKNFKYKEDNVFHKASKENKNIIVLMVESLSSYQSELFSGLNNWTPNIDKIANKNIFFTNFIANGFITEHAEVSILTGELPILPPNDYSKNENISFNYFYNIDYSVPNILKSKNYRTDFITSSDLNFSNTGYWAYSIGFNYSEGSEHKSYEGLKRIHFNAPEDKYLYKRVLSRATKKEEPYFIFVKTVSSHVPFINPETSNRSEEETIKYIDKQIGIFYEKLKKTNFFENGMLVILGDHHPAIPVKEEALSKLGENKAQALVPMIISFGDTKQKKITEQFQQVDLYNTILYYTGNKYYTNNYKGVYTHKNIISPKYIFHTRTDNRSLISLFSENGSSNIQLSGDDTNFYEDINYNNEEKKELIDKINSIRIKNREKYKYKYTMISELGGFPTSVMK